MAGIVNVEVGQSIPIELQIVDGNSALFPRAVITDDTNSWSVTLDLVHFMHGLYRPASAYIMPDEKWVSAVYIVYEDAGHTQISGTYNRDTDVFIKVDPTNKLDRILGLTQENQYIDNTIYDCGKMTSGRLRIYSNAGSVGTGSDVIATYTITVTYSGSDMVTYSMVKV